MKIKNIFRRKNVIVVTLDDDTTYRSNTCTDELCQKVKELFVEDYADIKDRLDAIFNPKKQRYINLVKNKSSILTMNNDSAYMLDISELTVPKLLVDKILEAEVNNDADAITAYKNFWTLLSLNPNSEVRNNLFWFIDLWNIPICKSGLLVTYRNVLLKSEGVKYNQKLTDFISNAYFKLKCEKKSPKDYYVCILNDDYKITDNSNNSIGSVDNLYNQMVYSTDEAGTVYTDDYTKTFEIRLGHIVSMPREEVDERVNKTCSKGLHTAGKNWLKHNYCGNIGLKCLVNPADICSCPKDDNYGKLRSCAYYPIQIVKFDKEDNIIDTDVPDGFEFDFINKISYTGTINNIDNDNYKLNLPKFITTKDLEHIFANLKEIANNINRRD